MRGNSGMRAVLDRLGSMTLAVVLLVVLAMASVIGTVLLQNQEQADYLNQFGPLWYWNFRLLGLFDMYHTGWFLSLLGFLMLSLAACLWRHVPRMLKDMRTRRVVIADGTLERLHHLRHWRVKGKTAAEVRAAIERQLAGWERQVAEHAGRTYLRADKGRHHKWGYILVHAAILIILIGGWISVQFGFRGNMAVVEGGQEHRISFLKGTKTEYLDMPFTVRCNDFNIEFFPTGQPKEFRSNLTIIEDGKEVLTSDIIVNKPLEYKGVHIYQASFGDGGSAVTLKLFRLDGSQKVDEVQTHVYETYTDQATGVSLQITDFRPYNIENMAGPGEPKRFQDLGPAVEFILRGPGLKPVKVKSFMRPLVVDGMNQGTLMLVSLTGEARDYQPLFIGVDLTNPREWRLYHAFAQRLQTRSTAGKAANLQAFKAALREVFGPQPPQDLQAMGVRVLQSVNVLPGLPWPFLPVLVDYDQVYYTGLQLTHDPGMNVVWFGRALLVIGLCIMFYMPHRKLWLVIQPKGNEIRLTLGGMTTRNRLGFEREFHQLFTKMQQALGPARD